MGCPATAAGRVAARSHGARAAASKNWLVPGENGSRSRNLVVSRGSLRQGGDCDDRSLRAPKFQYYVRALREKSGSEARKGLRHPKEAWAP